MAGLKILFVDDDVSMQEILRIRLSSWGHSVVQAFSGMQALGLLKSEKPDAVILDYMMPDMSGVDTLRAIRKIDKSVSVIMFTAYPDTKVMSEVERLNIAAFIPKLSTHSESQSALMAALQMIEKGLKRA